MEQLQKYLEGLEDFRINRHKLYPLEEILFLCVVSCICGLYEFEQIVDFGEMRISWLRQYYSYKNGIPSHDTINRVLKHIDPKSFNEVLMSWVKSIMPKMTSKQIDIDGKAICGTAPKIKDCKKLLHQVSAWSGEMSLVLAQKEVVGKGQEIEGILELLMLLDIENDTITIDAIGCQSQIVDAITEKKGHYVIAVKSNQRALYEEIENAFSKITLTDTFTQLDGEGGRVTTRRCSVIHHLDTFIPEAHRFAQSQTVIQIETERFDKKTQKTSRDKRYYISDLNQNAQHFNMVIRQHWSIENNLHWYLDVVLNEDNDRKRTKNLATNFALIRKMSLNLLLEYKQNQAISLKRIQSKALMNVTYLHNIIF